MKKLLLVAVSLLLVASCSKTNGINGDSASKTAIKYAATGSDAGEAGDLRSVHFDFDKFALTAEAKTILQKNADWLKKNSKKIQIEGHCDSRGTIEYNIALGEKRAATVKKYLVALGVKLDRINTISYGEERPLDSADTEAAWAKNRRANFVLVN